MIENEPQKRIEVVGSQRDVEIDVANADKDTATAIFIVPSMATPFFFDPDDIYQDEEDGLFKLREGVSVPEGLMPKDKAEDPKQLSTVLARVLSVREMIESGAEVFVVTVDPERGGVAAAKGALLNRYKDRFEVHQISQEFYDEIKNDVGAANYGWVKNGEFKCAAIFASQINKPNSTEKFDKLFGDEALPYLVRANDALRAVRTTVIEFFGRPKDMPGNKGAGNDLSGGPK